MESTNELLLRSYDEPLSMADQQLLKNALQSDPLLQKEKRTLDELRDRLLQYQPHFSTSFAQETLNRIYSTKKKDSFISLFKTIALSGAAAILLILLSIYFTDGSLNIDTLYGLSDYAADEELFTYLTN